MTIVTGSNCGIGYETALDFAKRGAHVIMACRDLKRSQPAADKIILESRNNKVEIEILDLSSQKSVRDFAERIKKRFKRIDILVNNAGEGSFNSVWKLCEVSVGILFHLLQVWLWITDPRLWTASRQPGPPTI